MSTLSAVGIAVCAILMCFNVWWDPSATRYHKSMITLASIIAILLSKVVMEIDPR
jgi:hypothetical protein